MSYLVVGLGNPGSAYANTRHNLGFLSVEKFAEKQGFSFRQEKEYLGRVAVGQFADQKVYLLLPSTYMNSSGESVRLFVNYFHIALSDILIVCDDINIPFGSLRLRSEGSTGGHNGLESIEAHLKTRAYARLRAGIGDRTHGDLADYVLGHFTAEEMKELPQIIEKTVVAIEQWLKENKKNVERKKTAL